MSIERELGTVICISLHPAAEHCLTIGRTYKVFGNHSFVFDGSRHYLIQGDRDDREWWPASWFSSLTMTDTTTPSADQPDWRPASEAPKLQWLLVRCKTNEALPSIHTMATACLIGGLWWVANNDNTKLKPLRLLQQIKPWPNAKERQDLGLAPNQQIFTQVPDEFTEFSQEILERLVNRLRLVP